MKKIKIIYEWANTLTTPNVNYLNQKKQDGLELTVWG